MLATAAAELSLPPAKYWSWAAAAATADARSVLELLRLSEGSEPILVINFMSSTAAAESLVPSVGKSAKSIVE